MLIVLIPLPEFVVGVVICLRPATPVYNFWCALQHWTQFTWIWLLTASFFYKGNPGFCISWGNPDFFFEEILTYASSFSVELSRTCYVDVYSLHWFFESTWVWLAALFVLCFGYTLRLGYITSDAYISCWEMHWMPWEVLKYRSLVLSLHACGPSTIFRTVIRHT